jgi:hypothetical protein
MANPSVNAALSPLSMNGVHAFCGNSHEVATDLLEQAQGIISVIQASYTDAADLRNANKSSEFASLNERLPHAALGAVSTLIALASAFGREG